MVVVATVHWSLLQLFIGHCWCCVGVVLWSLFADGRCWWCCCCCNSSLVVVGGVVFFHGLLLLLLFVNVDGVLF